MNFLVLHGPNLNLLGEREPEVYGHTTLEQLNRQVAEACEAAGAGVRFVQSNHEGVLIDELHAARRKVDGVIINPGALTHTSYALRDAIAGIAPPVVEVHLSDIKSREAFRAISLVEDVCLAQVSGKGVGSYLEGLEILLSHLTPEPA